jgi:hypothetical protein
MCKQTPTFLFPLVIHVFSLTKRYPTSTSIVAAYVPGMFIGYASPLKTVSYPHVRAGKVQFQPSGNHSCPEWNITYRCMEFFGGNSTDSTTGKIIGPSVIARTYDPRKRPWYISSMEEDSIWTPPYVFAITQQLGITAARQVVTNEGKVIGVIGTGEKERNLKILYFYM